MDASTSDGSRRRPRPFHSPRPPASPPPGARRGLPPCRPSCARCRPPPAGPGSATAGARGPREGCEGGPARHGSAPPLAAQGERLPVRPAPARWTPPPPPEPAHPRREGEAGAGGDGRRGRSGEEGRRAVSVRGREPAGARAAGPCSQRRVRLATGGGGGVRRDRRRDPGRLRPYDLFDLKLLLPLTRGGRRPGREGAGPAGSWPWAPLGRGVEAATGCRSTQDAFGSPAPPLAPPLRPRPLEPDAPWPAGASPALGPRVSRRDSGRRCACPPGKQE